MSGTCDNVIQLFSFNAECLQH